jgi:hypothetical protein
MHSNPPPKEAHLLEVCNLGQTDALSPCKLWAPVGVPSKLWGNSYRTSEGGGHVLSIMRVELSGRICRRDDHSFLWPQEPGRARHLGIPKAICLHELRIFSFYDSGAELAPFANGAPPCKRATPRVRFRGPGSKAGVRLNWRSKIVVCPCVPSILVAQVNCS